MHAPGKGYPAASTAMPSESESVTQDATRIRRHTLVAETTPVHGYVYGAKAGRLVEYGA